jgi:hypothetical protein
VAHGVDGQVLTEFHPWQWRFFSVEKPGFFIGNQWIKPGYWENSWDKSGIIID